MRKSRRRVLLGVALWVVAALVVTGARWAVGRLPLPPPPSGPPPGVTVGPPPDGPYLRARLERIAWFPESFEFPRHLLGRENAWAEGPVSLSLANGLQPLYVASRDMLLGWSLWDQGGQPVEGTPWMMVNPAFALLSGTLDADGVKECTFVGQEAAHVNRPKSPTTLRAARPAGDSPVTERLPRRCWLFYVLDGEVKGASAIGEPLSPVRVWGYGWTQYVRK